MSQFLFRLAMFGIAAVFIAGCSSSRNKTCPAAVIVSDASAMAMFPEGIAPDPSHMLYTAHVDDVRTDCDFDKDTRTEDSSLKISFSAERTPNGASLHGKVPYFVAVISNGVILTKHTYLAEFDFNPGASKTNFGDDVASVTIEFGKEKQPWDYQLMVGLQLSKAQLEYNR